MEGLSSTGPTPSSFERITSLKGGAMTMTNVGPRLKGQEGKRAEGEKRRRGKVFCLYVHVSLVRTKFCWFRVS